MQTLEQRTKKPPTGLPYWQPVINVTKSDAIDPEGARARLGSMSQATTVAALSDVDVVVLVGLGAVGASVANTFKSSLLLQDADVLWTRVAAGTHPFYVETPLEPLVDPPVVERSDAAAPPRAFRAFKDVGSWLDADDDEVADAVSIGRTTPYSWRREGHEPRARTVRQLYELHAVLAAVRRELGPSRFRGWLSSGSPSRRSRILAGDFTGIGRDVDAVLFAGVKQPDLAWGAEPTIDEGSRTQTTDVRPSGRPRRTARI